MASCRVRTAGPIDYGRNFILRGDRGPDHSVPLSRLDRMQQPRYDAKQRGVLKLADNVT